MQEIDVLYFYEFAARELDVACAVKCIGEREFGLKIQIEQHPYGELLSDLTRFNPRIVAWPHLASSNVSYVLEWPRAIYFNLMWEQILYKGNFNAKMPRGEFALRYAMHHLWSDQLVGALHDIGVPDENIVINGNLVYTLYEQPYRRYFDRRAELASQYRLDSSKRWIFFPENYNWAFYTETQLQSFIEGGQTADDLTIMRSFCQRSFAEVMRWCKSAIAQGAAEIILRPRPSTPLVDFHRAVKNILSDIPDGLHIIKDETVREWISASDSVVSSYSTSLIEAAVAGKPTFILAPLPIPQSIHMGWHDLTPHLTTQAEFETLCSTGLPRDDRIDRWARSTMMPKGDAVRGLVDIFARLIRGELRRPPFPPRSSLTLPPMSNLHPALLFEYHKGLRRYQRSRRKFRKPTLRVNRTYERELVAHEEIIRRVNRWMKVLYL